MNLLLEICVVGIFQMQWRCWACLLPYSITPQGSCISPCCINLSVRRNLTHLICIGKKHFVIRFCNTGLKLQQLWHNCGDKKNSCNIQWTLGINSDDYRFPHFPHFTVTSLCCKTAQHVCVVHICTQPLCMCTVYVYVWQEPPRAGWRRRVGHRLLSYRGAAMLLRGRCPVMPRLLVYPEPGQSRGRFRSSDSALAFHDQDPRFEQMLTLIFAYRKSWGKTGSMCNFPPPSVSPLSLNFHPQQLHCSAALRP